MNGKQGAQAGRVIDQERLTAGVAAYLADCRQHSALLSPKYHPTEEGVLKAVYHQATEEKRFIRDEFARLSQPEAEVPR